MSTVEAVFLDRDGTINEDSGYTSDPKGLRLIPGAPEAIASLNERSIPVVVVSNQAGVAHGHHTVRQVELFHEALSKELKKAGAHIDRFYYCPHHPEGIGEYRKVCDCRKPMPGMLLRAAKDLGLDLSRSVMVGDKASDIAAGLSVGCRTILVLTGHGSQELSSWKESFQPSFVAPDVHATVEWLFDTPA